MRTVRVANGQGRVLADRVAVADRAWHRFWGLSRRVRLDDGEGLLLTPCRAIHMFGMKFPLDVAFLDRDGTIVAIHQNLAPGARACWHRRAADALELPAGTLEASGTRVGDSIVCTDGHQ
jgi:uncharacterized membrane protein (UPF0127 family)